MKYYAVKKGRQTGIFTSWDKTRDLVSGYSGAIYKSFSTKEEAVQFLGHTQQVINVTQTEIPHTTIKTEISAYVDGSFDRTKGYYASGIVLLKDDDVVDELSIADNDKRFVESFQIAGEVLACLIAMQWAVDHDYDSLTIYYDYQGIEMWANGSWKTNKPISQYYKKQFDCLKNNVRVVFAKVKAHSGIIYNERADQLARKALSNV